MTAYDELSAWTLGLADATFTHQHVVDAHAAQVADANTKPIALAMALVGLYLHVEHRWTGRSVQMAHMRLARARREWPAFVLPFGQGAMTEADVLASDDRVAAIDAWAEEVWNAYAGANRATVEQVLREGGITP